ncbi:MAG TPA: DUF4239 domain-containing protein [Pyrinomonadaceae bacterium]|jgi:phage-related holin
MSDWLWGSVVVALAVLAAVGGMLLVRRSVSVSVLESHNEVAGFIYAVVGVVYAVLLAFIVIVGWESHTNAETRAEQEANSLGDLFRNAEAFPVETKLQLREHLRAYTKVVIEKEWAKMAEREQSPEAWDAFYHLWQGYHRFEPHNARESAWYAQSLERLNDLGDNRRLRLLSSRSSVPSLMWLVIVVGSVITVAFSYFFGTRNTLAQILMTAGLAATLALILLLIADLEHPFSGLIRVEPQAFEQIMDVFDRWSQMHPNTNQ